MSGRSDGRARTERALDSSIVATGLVVGLLGFAAFIHGDKFPGQPTPAPLAVNATAPAHLSAQQSLEAASDALSRSVGHGFTDQWFALSTATRELAGAIADRSPALPQAQARVDDLWPAFIASFPAQTAPPATQQDAQLAAEFHHHLSTIGAGWVQVRIVSAPCDQQDLGEFTGQGCAQSNTPGVIYLKRVDPSLAMSDGGKYLALHEYSHLLQYEAGATRVIAAAQSVFGDKDSALEQSADCMTGALMGGDYSYGAYTTDCSGARGELARSLLVGDVPDS